MYSNNSQHIYGAMPPPHLQTSIPHVQPPNDPLQSPQMYEYDREPTPPPPAYSPVTPQMSASFLAAPPNTTTSTTMSSYPYAPPAASSPDPPSTTHGHPQPRLHLKGPAPIVEPPQPPAPEPISLEDNPDAIALRAAMSVLQMQRQQALKDMRTLEKQKTRALGDVEGFTKALADGSLKMRNASGILPESAADGDHEGRGEVDGAQVPRDQQREQPGQQKDFGRMEIPSAQNVVRMPPINWAKYHVVGESLDRLHKEQKVRPTPGVPEGTRREAEVAAPYDPFVDNLESATKGESAGTGISGGSAGTQIEGMNTRRKSGGLKKG